VTRHSDSLRTRRKYSELAEGHERDLVHELREYEANGGDLDAICQHIDDATSTRVWDLFLTNYKSFDRTASPPPTSSSGHRGEGRGSGKGRGRGKGGSYGRSVTACRYFAKGKCTRGANCEFSHDLMPTKGARGRGGKGGRGRGGYGGRGGTKGGRKGGRRMEEATVEAF